MNNLKNSFKKFHLSLDFLPSAIINKTTGDGNFDAGLDTWFKVGAPLTYPIESSEQFCQKFSFEKIEQISSADAIKKYAPDKLDKFDLKYFELYYFTTVKHFEQ